MIDLMSRPHSLVSNFDLVQEILKTYGPDQFHAMRQRALAEFERVGLPTTADEEFKYVSLKVLQEGQFQHAYGATVDRHQVSKTGISVVEALTLAFVNGEFSPELSTAHALPEGVFVGTLVDGMIGHSQLILDKLGKAATLTGKLGTTNDERFVHLNTAYLGEGAFVYLPRGIIFEQPIHLQWLTTAEHGPMAAHPRNLIVLEEGAQAKILESYLGLKGTYFTNSVTEVFMAKSAVLELNRLQNETESSVHISTTSVIQDAGSNITATNLNFGGQVVRNDVNVWLDGEHTETWLNGVAIGTGNQVVDNHTRIDHAKPNCHSFETYKTVLDDSAHGVFNGKIFVYEDAQKTDAKQTNQALLLSRTATINTKPQLEIFADDVKCTHGATIGQLREDALFYFQSRGIPKAEAQALLVYAFAAEVIEKITLPELKQFAEKLLYQKLKLKQLPADVV